MSVKNGFGFSAGSSKNGPYTAGYGYIQGRTLNQPANHYMTDYDLQPVAVETPPTRSSPFLLGLQTLNPDWHTFLHSGLDFKSILMGAALGYGATMFGTGGALSGILPALRDTFFEPETPTPAKVSASVPVPISTNSSSASQPSQAFVQDPIPGDSVAEGEKRAPAPTENSSSRRRRRNIEFDTDLTELASMVLSAIQSGECMQRSICLLGSRIGSTDKGKLGFLLVDKLIPQSVQGSQYFVTLKKALRGGESYCDRFRCRFN